MDRGPYKQYTHLNCTITITTQLLLVIYLHKEIFIKLQAYILNTQ